MEEGNIRVMTEREGTMGNWITGIMEQWRSGIRHLTAFDSRIESVVRFWYDKFKPINKRAFGSDLNIDFGTARGPGQGRRFFFPAQRFSPFEKKKS